MAPLSPVLRGMLWMVATGVLFTVLNTILKKVSEQLDPWVVGWLRYLLGALIMLPPVLRHGLARIRPSSHRLQVLRGMFHTGGLVLWFAALPMISLAELTAIAFSGPLFICLGAVLFLGERMSPARWAAVMIGFGGVILVIHPWEGDGFSGVSLGVLLMLGSAPLFSGGFLVAKFLTRRDPSDVIVLWQHVWVSALFLPFALSRWAAPSLEQWSWLVLCGLLGAAGHYCTTRAFHVADISATQSVKFLDLVWAALLGFAVFGTVPAGWTVVGGIVILVSTLWLARRESRGT
ncbi:MAG: DMT family transporter [Betaproteobacteria bacterium]